VQKSAQFCRPIFAPFNSRPDARGKAAFGNVDADKRGAIPDETVCGAAVCEAPFPADGNVEAIETNKERRQRIFLLAFRSRAGFFVFYEPIHCLAQPGDFVFAAVPY
jgi:hypothetical protein